MKCTFRFAIWAACLLGLACEVASAQQELVGPGAITIELSSAATLTTSQTGTPVHGTFAYAGDQRLFVVGRGGQIKIVENGNLLPTPFLDFTTALGGSTLLTSGGERGLLGTAFHPDFNTPGADGFGKFYTYSSEVVNGIEPTFNHPEAGVAVTDHHDVLREWSVVSPTSNQVDYSAGSRVLMRMAKPMAYHNGGSLAFGPDKYLYMSVGDGGDPYDASVVGSVVTLDNPADGHTNAPNPNPLNRPHGNAQDRTNVMGKILRIKPTTDIQSGIETLSANGQYAVPNSNPFTATSGGDPSGTFLDEVYAFGLRNPFRMSFDRGGDHKLIAADVGQVTREEVDIIVSGGNYGWVIKEGSQNTPGMPAYTAETPLIDPIGEYLHTANPNAARAVIGGYAYRGSLIPELQGKYVFGDLGGLPPSVNGSGRLFYMDITEPGPNTIYELLFGPSSDAKPISALNGFGEDANGELYAMFSNGRVMQLKAQRTPGDFDGDGDVDGADFVAWQTHFPTASGATPATGDADGDGDVDGADFVAWQTHFPTPSGATAPTVPEPTAWILAMIGLVAFSLPRMARSA
jgi:glucose/arabinose dehydrogenase